MRTSLSVFAVALASSLPAQATVINLNEVCLTSLASFLYGHLGVCGAPPNLILSKSDSYAPWTSKPQCLQSLDPETDTEPYCVFSKKDFAGGRGIVFITTETVAKDIISKPAFTDSESIATMNDLISPPWGPPPYNKLLIPNRGYGMIANRTIFRGERIMQETPSFVYNRELYSLFEDEDRIPLHWNAAYTLPEETREELISLHKQHGGDEIDDLMRTNAFGAYYGEPYVLHNNVLPRIARFNHDCRPNAHYYFDLETMTQYVNAVRTINVGEEILINYTDAENTFVERQHAIELSWGFSCQCSICRQPPTHVAASDQRLQLIKKLKEDLNDWSEILPSRVHKAETLITLYEKERLDVPIATAYESAAYAYAINGDEENAQKYASLAVESMTILYGADHPLTMDLEVMMLDPKEHRTWLYKLPKADDEATGTVGKSNKTEKETVEQAKGSEETTGDKWKFF